MHSRLHRHFAGFGQANPDRNSCGNRGGSTLSKLPRVSGKQVVAVLQRLGFRLQRIRGSHYFLHHPERDVTVSVPVHASKILAPKTLLNILKAARISRDEFIKALRE
ncbi:MAG: type II toxin-antitoxin system HicA family toxin [Armatimonadota bacterium]